MSGVPGLSPPPSSQRVLDSPAQGMWRPTGNAWSNFQRTVFQVSVWLADQHEHGRSRIRVARGWALNSVFIGLALPTFLQWQFASEFWCHCVGFGGSLGFLVLAAACGWSWSQLCGTEYLKIREHAEFLSSIPSYHGRSESPVA